MSGKVQRIEHIELTSAASAVTSAAFHLGANPWDVQFVAPASLCRIEGSNDKLNWETMKDMFDVEITSLGSVTRVGLERPKWLRFYVAVDAGQPQKFTAIIAVGKEQGS